MAKWVGAKMDKNDKKTVHKKIQTLLKELCEDNYNGTTIITLDI